MVIKLSINDFTLYNFWLNNKILAIVRVGFIMNEILPIRNFVYGFGLYKIKISIFLSFFFRNLVFTEVGKIRIKTSSEITDLSRRHRCLRICFFYRCRCLHLRKLDTEKVKDGNPNLQRMQ